MLLLDRLGHEAAHSLGGFPLHLIGHVGVGVQGEARTVMAQDGGHRFGIYSLLDCQRGEGVTQSVEGDVFGDSGLFQQFFVQPSDTVWPIELACYRGGEHDGVGGVLAVFLDQQVDGLLRQENCPHRVGGFGLGYLYIAVDPASRLVYLGGEQPAPFHRADFPG